VTAKAGGAAEVTQSVLDVSNQNHKGGQKLTQPLFDSRHL